MKRKSVSRKGVAMLWAVLVILMVAMLSAGIIMVCRAYYSRELDENYRVQAQLLAEDAIELVSSQIEAGYTNEDDSVNEIYQDLVSDVDGTYTIDVDFEEDSNWDCKVTISHSGVNEYEYVDDEEEAEEILEEIEDELLEDDEDEEETEETTDEYAGDAGVIYLTARVSRENSSTESDTELAEVCAKMVYSDDEWIFAGYYNL